MSQKIFNCSYRFLIIILCYLNFYQFEQIKAQILSSSYNYWDELNPIYLDKGDSQFERIQLEEKIHFFSETYDHIYINTNGILTFITEFPEYLNQPFPLEYPSISPFYSNIDTTGSNELTKIVFFKSQDPEHLRIASDLINQSFIEEENFQATIIYVASWENVGYYNARNDKQNSFQVAIICSRDQTYVQFVYPKDGINWLQAEIGDLGIPDVRAQAGFISEDGRLFTLNGSGTDNVRYLNSLTNVGKPGVWVYRVGPLAYNEEVGKPNDHDNRIKLPQPKSCTEGLYQKCHSAAECIDKFNGFCCRCKEGYYGNGHSCIKSKLPIRVAGTVSGTVNGQQIDSRARLQSYVITADGRSYTSINPISPEIGSQFRLVLPVGGAIGWLFAKPWSTALNGYQLTGGRLNHESTLMFKQSGEVFTVNQTFEGLNYWDQLSIKTEVSGRLPYVSVDSELQSDDYIEEYSFLTPNRIQSVGNIKIKIPKENRVIEFELEQVITFDRCMLDTESFDSSASPILQKVAKISLNYSSQENAIRMIMLNKIGVDPESNACTDGTANCGQNTICIPQADGYDCVCMNGYAPDVTDSDVEYCVDIDECRGGHICDENAHCQNTLGGYLCTCYEGYEGNGYECTKVKTPEENEFLRTSTDYYYDYTTTSKPLFYDSPCNKCSLEAYCINNVCVCKEGWTGDGYHCTYNCRVEEVWSNGRCVAADSIEETDKGGSYYNYDEYEINTDSRTDDNWSGSKSEEGVIPCDVVYNCHSNASCQWIEEEMKSMCVCVRGYEGDGYQSCIKIEKSCTTDRSICDVHATCVYNEYTRKSECKCDRGYEGDGFTCQLAPECRANEHCTENAFCDNGVCRCLEGFERDLSDFCAPAGYCGGTICAQNAICKWEPIQKVSYCECLEGYEGDGVRNCKSIPPPCNVRNTCGLHASCIQSSRSKIMLHYECVCDRGYYGDGFTCVEERNCLNTPGLCDLNASCKTISSGLQCVCNLGFIGNGTYCKEISTKDTGYLVASQGDVIVRLPFNGKLGRPISTAQMAVGLDKDCAEGRIYWGDISNKTIRSAKYDGTDVKTFISDDIESPEGVAIDWISRRLYWTDSTKDTIEVASLDNPSQRAVIINKHLVNPRGIAVDPFKNKLYWTDWNRELPKIEMSNLDGTDRKVLLSKERLILPNSLVVLRHSNELCYADAGTRKIECLDTYFNNDNKSIRTIASNLSYPFGLANTDDHFYWTDWTIKQIESVDFMGTRKPGIRTRFFLSHKMYGLTAVTDSCPVIYSPCSIDNGGCTDERICLVNENSPSSKACKCTRLSKSCNSDINNIDY